MNTKKHTQKTHSSLKILLGISLITAVFATAPTAYASQSTGEDDAWVEDVADVELFVKIYDTDADQLLSHLEIQQAIQNDIQSHDNNGDGKISIEEYKVYSDSLMEKMALTEFQDMDNDQSHDLSEDEIIKNYHQLESRIFTKQCLSAISTSEELRDDAKQELAELDSDNNLRISFEEFSLSTDEFSNEEFQEMDTNNDGQIVHEEWKTALEELAIEASMIKKNMPLDC